jgi:hypothetical protein
MEWVTSVINGVKKSPFARIKTMSADITHDEARAKGYVKGNLKKEEWFKLRQPDHHSHHDLQEAEAGP